MFPEELPRVPEVPEVLGRGGRRVSDGGLGNTHLWQLILSLIQPREAAKSTEK